MKIHRKHKHTNWKSSSQNDCTELNVLLETILSGSAIDVNVTIKQPCHEFIII